MLKIEQQFDARKLLFMCVYRSPSSDLVNDKLLFELLTSVLKNGHMYKPLIIGDFNFPHINWDNWTVLKSDNSSDLFLQCLRDNYAFQYVDKPTRARSNDTPHILDLVITTDDFISEIVHSSPLGNSDHAVLQIYCKKTEPILINADNKFDFNKGDYDALRQSLCIDWGVLFDACDNDINKMWDTFKNIIHTHCNIHIPKKSKPFCGKKTTWTTPLNIEVRKMIKRKHRLWSRYVETKDPKIYNKFKETRNNVRREIRKIRRVEQLSVAQNCKANPKAFWSYIKKKTKSNSFINDLKYISDDGKDQVASTDTDKADVLSKFFSSVYMKEPQLDNDVVMHDSSTISYMDMFTINVGDILKRLSDLNVYKSAGPDNLFPRILYEIRNEIAFPLLKIFELSLSANQIPDDWKNAIIAPIFKKGDKHAAKNYRPVSLTCIVCKILESIIRDHILEHFLTNNLFSSKQYGFLKGRSTVLQLLRLMDDWTNLLENGGQIDSIYTDLEKAFDKIPHKRLLLKLRNYNVHPRLINWIECFLCYRKQCVKVNGKLSHWLDVLSGVPQGTILGPLLFIIYINDLPEVCKNLCSIFLYADDAKLYKHVLQDKDHTDLQTAVDSMQEWMKKWLLKLNIDKCKVVSYGRHVIDYQYHMNYYGSDVAVEKLSNITDLGVNFDDKLSFKDHITDKTNKAYGVLGIIKRNFDNLSTDAFLMLYKSMVRSHLEYAGALWNPYRKGDIKRLEKVQMRATKLVNSVKHLSYENRLQKLKLPTLKYRRLRGDMIEVFKIIHGKYDKTCSLELELYQSVHATRTNSLKLTNSRCHYDLRKYFFSCRIVNIWNSLPSEVVNAPSLNSFKNRLDRFWFNQDILYNWHAELTKTGSRSIVS